MADEADRRDEGQDDPRADEGTEGLPEAEDVADEPVDAEPLAQARPDRTDPKDLAEALGRDAGGAETLAAEMRQAQSAAGGQAVAPPQPSDGPPPGRRTRRRAPAGHARAATHVSFKRVMWLPALLMGLVCVGTGIYSGVGYLSADVPEPPGKVLKGPNGRLWVIDAEATDITWEGGEPRGKLPGGWDAIGKLPVEDRAFERYLVERKAATRWLFFAVAFPPVGLILLGLGLWMRRDVKLVAAREAEAGAAHAEGVRAAEEGVEKDIEEARDRAGAAAGGELGKSGITDAGAAEVVSEPDETPPEDERPEENTPEDEAPDRAKP